MPSKVFQPLLYDTFQYKPSNTTYHDAFKWRRLRSFNKKRVPASERMQNMHSADVHSHLNANTKKVTSNVSLEIRFFFY